MCKKYSSKNETLHFQSDRSVSLRNKANRDREEGGNRAENSAILTVTLTLFCLTKINFTIKEELAVKSIMALSVTPDLLTRIDSVSCSY